MVGKSRTSGDLGASSSRQKVGIFSVLRANDDGHWHRLVVQVTVRTTTKHGQILLLPDLELEGWTTSLNEKDYTDEKILQLYRDHASSEQFHSEFKTDLDLERLPSGKFDTNDLVMAMGVLAYNLLRWIGQQGLLGDKAPIRHPAKRRRLRTVMQEVIGVACRMLNRGRRLTLRFGSHCPVYDVWQEVYSGLG